MDRVRGAACALVALTAGLGVAGCGSTRHSPRTRPAKAPAPLAALGLPTAGTPAAKDASSWTQYGGKPVGTTLTINAVTVYDRGPAPLVLVGIRQAKAIPGLTFKTQLATTSKSFATFSEQVRAGTPAAEFGIRPQYTPIAGYILEPSASAQISEYTPSLVVTAVASKPGVYHLGDWLVTYAQGSQRHTLKLYDDGEFCIGSSGCPSLG